MLTQQQELVQTAQIIRHLSKQYRDLSDRYRSISEPFTSRGEEIGEKTQSRLSLIEEEMSQTLDDLNEVEYSLLQQANSV